MNKFVKAFVIIAAFAAPATTVFAQTQPAAKPAAEVKYKTPELNRAEIDAWLAKPDKVVFIDLRRPDEISTIGSFPVYLNIQLADLEKYAAYIPKDRSIITVSNHAGRAFKAGDLLLSKGFKVVGAAGSQHYEDQGGTITRIVKPEPKPAAPADATKK
ncbi:MAG: rhodanese-like domain-containing protein [Gammaproteobacteria bacterium]|nr:MAG: rhodanese-like domain-containing protein [Gammaproteobacteria bacterium]